MKIRAYVVAAVISASFGLSVSDVGAETYYTCRSGFDFQTSGDAARCYQAGRVETGAVRPCLPGQRFQIDYNRNRDMCYTGIGTAALSAPPGCPNGWRLTVRNGADRCERRLNPQVEAPTRAVNR